MKGSYLHRGLHSARRALLLLTGVFLIGTFTWTNGQSTSSVGQRIACQGGEALGFGCEAVDLLSVLSRDDIGALNTCGGGTSPCRLNDIWGWTDEATGREFALVGREDGVAFVEVTDPVNPVYVGELLLNGSRSSAWRDVKTYMDYAYIVADGSGGLGIQVFDLKELYSYTIKPITFQATAVYDGFGRAHNIAINEDTGYAYAVGAAGGTSCAGGLHMVSLEQPDAPTFAGCFAHGSTGRIGTGYTHDVQCVIYHGPDTDHQGREICFGANETHISIADVTDKTAPVAISKADYPFASYVHQGWLTDDHKYFLQNDELDESNASEQIQHTRTLVWDVEDLDDPVLLTEYFGPGSSTDHNLYVRGNFVFQSNYVDGLRILDISDIAAPVEVGSFDTEPSNGSRFSGSWSNYPFFRSGAIAVTSRDGGLFMVLPTIPDYTAATSERSVPEGFLLSEAYPNPFSDRLTISFTSPTSQAVQVMLYDVLGREVKMLFDGAVVGGSEQRIESKFTSLPDGQYFYRISGEDFTVSRPVIRLKKGLK